MHITLDAYAKINLYLDIVSRRSDGYHDIKGIMQKVSLCDTVTLTLTPSGKNEIAITCTDPAIPTGEKNIAYKAAEAFLSNFTSETYKVEIGIEKRIPAAGGLAGGSTDAAAVLCAMRELLGVPKSKHELLTLGAKLGADVPFCCADGSMITEGIGDILSPAPSISGCTVLISNSGESVSTPEAYRQLDRVYRGFCDAKFDEARFERLCVGLRKKDLECVCEAMYNVFEDVVLKEKPKAAEARSIMLSHGAAGAMMSGSGPTVFGLFKDKADAERSYKALSALGYDTHICTPID